MAKPWHLMLIAYVRQLLTSLTKRFRFIVFLYSCFESASRQDGPIQCFDWLPGRAPSCLLGISCVGTQEKVPSFGQACKVKMARYWPRFFCVFVDLDFVSVYKNSQKELDRYPTILTMLGQKRICILLLILCVLV